MSKKAKLFSLGSIAMILAGIMAEFGFFLIALSVFVVAFALLVSSGELH